MVQDITNFLPKYPNIQKLEREIFNPYEEDFYESIYKKKEFYDEKLQAVEDFPESKGTLMMHQKLIARFFSSQTLYDQLLLVHEMGTGKTCSAIGAIEQIRSEGDAFRSALYLAKGDALINNFINELVFNCTDGRYIPEDYEQLTELEKIHRTKKAIRDYYTLNTFETFAKEIKKSSDIELKKKYNNHIIVVDEVHNLRIQSKEKGLNIYKQFMRFLHVVQDCKILLMSGTPMKDSVEEISTVMNLILPLRDGRPYLSTGENFLNEFFNGSGDSYTVKNEKKKELKEIFRGRVSYLKAIQSQVEKKFVGEHVNDLNHFNVVSDYMDEFQTQIYNQAYEVDRSERKGVYSNSRQASLFVFPDGSYGDKGYNKYIQKIDVSRKIIGNKKIKKLYKYIITPELSNAITKNSNGNYEKMLENLDKFSSKYSSSIRTVLKSQKEGKSVFIYNEFVQGSGLILFGLILELFGFSKATGTENTGSEKPRYASLTNLTATTKQIRKLINRFNQPDNINGKIINVVMGSRKISEGFSLQNIQVEDIHTPWFNYSETAQAIARGYRFGSHRMLIDNGIIPILTIYQRVSIPLKNNFSIDLFMYRISEIKDISIKGVERLIKESAWDCALTYSRNHITGYNNERECDYMQCEYTCDGIKTNMIDTSINNVDLDYSTYQLYYQDPNVRKIIDTLVLIFRDNFRIDMLSIINYFPEYSEFEIISALRKIINESIQITNKYGYPSYLKEENNIYFLVDNLSVIGSFSSDYYTEYPHITKTINFTQTIKPLYLESLPNVIADIYEAKVVDDIRKIMNRLPLEVQEFFIEGSIIAKNKNIEFNSNIRELILKYFENYFAKIDGIWMSWLLYDQQGITRCLREDIWEDCTKESLEKVEEYRKEIQIGLEQNPYGYFGQDNPETGDFCIRDVSEDTPEKGHLVKSGRRCVNWKREKIVPMVIEKLKIPIPNKEDIIEAEKKLGKRGGLRKAIDSINKMSRENIITEISKNKYVNHLSISELDIEELRRILFWGRQQIKPSCMYIRNWFTRNGLIEQNKGCGTSAGKKPKTKKSVKK